MEIIKVNGVEYNLPESWSEITLEQQLEISKVVDRDEDFRNVHLISTYTGIPMDLIRAMNINQFKEILEIIQFIKEPLTPKTITEFTFNGETYFLAESMLRGQTQDFLSIEGVLKKYKDNQSLALPYIIAIIAKKKDETLDKFDVHKRANEFLKLDYQLANDVWFFFARAEKIYSINTKQFLQVQDKVMEMSLNYSENTLKQSDGLPLSKRLLRAILLSYIRSTRRSWSLFLTTMSSEPSKLNWIQRFKKNIQNKLKRKEGK